MLLRMQTLDTLIRAKFPGESLVAIAGKIGISIRALHKLRFGAVRTPHPATVAAMARSLETDPQTVIDAIEESRKAAV